MGSRTRRRGKLQRAVRLVAANLLEEDVQRALSRGGVSGAREVMRAQAHALLDGEVEILVVRIEPELEAGYLPESDRIVLQPWLVRKGSVDEVREALLEESLHRCLTALGYRDEDHHHRLIEPVLARARGL